MLGQLCCPLKYEVACADLLLSSISARFSSCLTLTLTLTLTLILILILILTLK